MWLAVKAVELEIQKIEAAQAQRHVQLLTAFLPETFVRRGGEFFILLQHDAMHSASQDVCPSICLSKRSNVSSSQVVNSHLVRDPTIWQPGFDLPRQQWSLLNRFRTEQGHCGASEGNGDLQTLICVLVARPRRCPTLSNSVP